MRGGWKAVWIFSKKSSDLVAGSFLNPAQPSDGLGRPFYGSSSGVLFSDLNDQRWNCHRPVGAAAQVFPPFPHLFVPRGVMLARTGERGGVFFIILVCET